MADEVKNVPQAKAKGYKLANGGRLDIPRVGIKITDEDLKDPNIVALIQRKAPEVFGKEIVPA